MDRMTITSRIVGIVRRILGRNVSSESPPLVIVNGTEDESSGGVVYPTVIEVASTTGASVVPCPFGARKDSYYRMYDLPASPGTTYHNSTTSKKPKIQTKDSRGVAARPGCGPRIVIEETQGELVEGKARTALSMRIYVKTEWSVESVVSKLEGTKNGVPYLYPWNKMKSEEDGLGGYEHIYTWVVPEDVRCDQGVGEEITMSVESAKKCVKGIMFKHEGTRSVYCLKSAQRKDDEKMRMIIAWIATAKEEDLEDVRNRMEVRIKELATERGAQGQIGHDGGR